MKGDHPFRRTAKGATGGGYRRGRTQVGFDDKTREIITALAIVNNRSFAAEVRDLVARALADGTQSKKGRVSF